MLPPSRTTHVKHQFFGFGSAPALASPDVALNDSRGVVLLAHDHRFLQRPEALLHQELLVVLGAAPERVLDVLSILAALRELVSRQTAPYGALNCHRGGRPSSFFAPNNLSWQVQRWQKVVVVVVVVVEEEEAKRRRRSKKKKQIREDEVVVVVVVVVVVAVAATAMEQSNEGFGDLLTG